MQILCFLFSDLSGIYKQIPFQNKTQVENKPLLSSLLNISKARSCNSKAHCKTPLKIMVLLPLFCTMLSKMAHRVIEFICSPEGCWNVSEVVAVFYTAVCIQALLFSPYKLLHCTTRDYAMQKWDQVWLSHSWQTLFDCRGQAIKLSLRLCHLDCIISTNKRNMLSSPLPSALLPSIQTKKFQIRGENK